jgi:hypothetical protein
MSKEILKSELDVSSLYQNSIESSHIIQFRPVSAFTDAITIEFVIPGSSEEYIDLQNIFLWWCYNPPPPPNKMGLCLIQHKKTEIH